ncbi:MAG: dicarboxylate/amino acid:cation symporter [Bacteroidales bacterium]|nr:dicarboxylate/amino acid:cation symporter [Bacteroidales bacterium]MBN2820191.1 dicarboxylate/amino acid:cation symporter [Bacteroidales bacterium]
MLRKIPLHWQILIGIILGVIFGIFLKPIVPYLSVLGILFIRALKMIVVPLIMSSLIIGVTNIQQGSTLGRIGIKTLVYYLSTSILAILTGLFLVNIVKPGVGANIDFSGITATTLEEPSLKDTIINIVPDNIFQAISSADMLAIIFFSLLLGVFITKLEATKRQLLTNIFDAVFEVMMKITLFVIRFAPIGVMGIVVDVVSVQENLPELMIRLGKFALVVVVGLAFHLLITLPLILYFIGKVNPVKHYKALLNVFLTAFSTASSNATLPLTIETIEEKSGVSNRIASFTLPLGATINMDGTALYELVVAGFIAQALGYDLSLAQQFVLVTTALLASIGTAGVPMASFVTMTIIFTSVGLPIEAMFFVMPIDRPLDMLRTATNVMSDTCGAVIIARSEKEKLHY